MFDKDERQERVNAKSNATNDERMNTMRGANVSRVDENGQSTPIAGGVAVRRVRVGSVR